MAVTILTGLTGAGKSHQAMKYIIAPAYKAGRVIKTNIKGIKEDELIKYCLEDGTVKEEELGKLIVFADNSINSKDFYPYLTEEDNKEVINDEHTEIKSGDVLVIDEAFQFFGDNVSKETMTFFTMHRHFTHPTTGLAIEICLLVQEHTLINRKIMKLAKNTYICKKLDFLGFSKSYTLKIYDGGKVQKQCLINTKTEKYDPKIFKLYDSYAGGKGKEKNLDKRTNILNNWKTYVVIGFIIAVPFCIYKAISIIKKPKGSTVIEQQQQDNKINSTNQQQQQKPQLQQQSNFRIAGVIDLGTKRLVMLEDENHTLKMVQPQLCIGKGLTMICNIDNQQISYYNRLVNKEQKNENKNNNQNNNNKNNN